ncbi:NAD(P)H-dependent oxidoreductase [Kitasatospora sp. NBC_00315]|uniref:NAD(P)H-dependent oxidoreductase n=1 Tax=Kitasatospora sp. NBC_00315 TaxID=2975963 RepID=UPI00324CCC9F
MSTRSTLVVVAHPNLAGSRANAAMVAAIGDLDNVTVHDLYAAYPDFRIDVAREQELLRTHDTVVLQFPLYWYSTTPLLKAWFDQVLTINFAFTFDGTASELRGKQAWAAVTVGGDPGFYTREGFNTVAVEEYLRPLQQTLGICQFEDLGHLKVHGLMTGALSDEDLALHAKQYRALLASGGSPATTLAAVNPCGDDHAAARVLARLAGTHEDQPVDA